MDLNTPSTPQTSSDSSSEPMSITTPCDPELEDGSESGWRIMEEEGERRPIFYMGDEDGRFSSPPFHRNLDGQKIKVGICAMSKKTNSKPMKEILARLERFEHLQIEVFDEQLILGAPVEEWPVVDALISFFSMGFPLDKAIQYKNLNKPFVVNDLEAQYSLKDRREVYKILVREGIAHPRYAVMNRDEEDKGDFAENEDAIEVNGVSFQRPFVEKPVNAEDHNIYIYFPMSAGGGSQRLFRKVGSRSSVYSSISRVRKTGSYIYEDFMPTDGTDVKVYTVGPDYAHAEARKSPALDGKVERDKDGKEIRYPVLLSAMEKIIARKVCTAFKQNVCGFDLLRTGGMSYVCDVNGFSFVKNSTKYYDDCANVLGTMIVRALAPQLHIPLVLGAAPEDIPVVPTTSGSMMELRCVIAVIRHGDRTPKQKMKMEVKHKKFFTLFEKYNGYKKGHLKLKKPKQLQEVLDIARDLLNESHDPENPEVQEKKAKLRQLKLVLEMYGHFSGINRKVQLKYQPYGAPKKSSSEEGVAIEGIKHSLLPNEYPKEPSLVLIVKWGGELTPAGKYQAEDLGKAFRTLYPGGQGEFETPGLGFLRLHSTFRHDLKLYASDEGRVQMTAAAFTKGLLALEGELTPILVSMVKSANTNGLLDKEGETSKYQHVVKERMMDILNQDRDFNDEDMERLLPTGSMSLKNAVKYIQNPKKMCDRVYTMVQEIVAKIRTLKMELKSRDLKLYHGESWELLIRRWAKLEKDFKLKTGNYDISKIPDIYDCIKYDLQHNQNTLQFSRAEELFNCSKALADIVIPQEYGITVEEKLHISQSICTPLMRKIHNDLTQGSQGFDENSTRLNSKYSKGVASPERFVRTRLYFTSESHIHSLLNMLRYGGLCDDVKDEQWQKAMNFLSNTSELNYMTQINIMMFEDPTKDSTSPEKFHVELHFSPGAYTSCDKNIVNPVSSGYRTSFFTRQGKKHADGDNSVIDNKNTITEDVINEAEEVIPEETMNSMDSEISCSKSSTDVKEMADGSSVSSVTSRDPFVSPKECDESPTLTLPAEKKVIVKVNNTDVLLEEGNVMDTSDIEDIERDAQENDNVMSENAITELDKKNKELQMKDDEDIAAGELDNESTVTPSSVTGENLMINTEKAAKCASYGEVIDDLFQVFEDTVNANDTSNPGGSETELLGKKTKKVPQPRSPDPNIPEWDWDDTAICENTPSTEKTDSSSEAALHDNGSKERLTPTPRDLPLSKFKSDPIPINLNSPMKDRKRPGSSTGFESVKSYEEKRSRSLEDHEDGESSLAMMEKHYRTIHLPINKDSHHSVSSLLYLNPEAFKAFDGFNMVPSLKPLETLHNNLTMQDMDAFLSRATTTKFFTPVSSPMFSQTPLPSPRCPEFARAKSIGGTSLPSSCSSSAGPSSPSSATTPVDFMSKLKLCITDSKNQQTPSSKTDLADQHISSRSESGSQQVADRGEQTDKEGAMNEQSTVNQRRSSNTDQAKLASKAQTCERSMNIDQNKTVNAEAQSDGRESCSVDAGKSVNLVNQCSEGVTDPADIVPPCGSTASSQIRGPAQVSSIGPSAGYQSAFKTVTRSSNQRSSFHVTQVSEESLGLKKPEADKESDS